MHQDKSAIIKRISALLLENDTAAAVSMIRQAYPHTRFETEKRSYTTLQKMIQFIKDGFIDRYTGERLLNPGILKVISAYLPDEFPFHSHWKMTQTHIAYWELVPTIDHVYPIAKGGQDHESNWVTTSMKNNSIKSNYTIDDIHWRLYPKGDMADWDGLTSMFIELVEHNPELLSDSYIKTWYSVSKKLCSH